MNETVVKMMPAMNIVKMPVRSREECIRIKDIPLSVTMSELCQNVSWSYKIMQLIAGKRYNEAFDLANTILNHNNAIVSKQVDTEAVMKLINSAK